MGRFLATATSLPFARHRKRRPVMCSDGVHVAAMERIAPLPGTSSRGIHRRRRPAAPSEPRCQHLRVASSPPSVRGDQGEQPCRRMGRDVCPNRSVLELPHPFGEVSGDRVVGSFSSVGDAGRAHEHVEALLVLAEGVGDRHRERRRARVARRPGDGPGGRVIEGPSGDGLRAEGGGASGKRSPQARPGATLPPPFQSAASRQGATQ